MGDNQDTLPIDRWGRRFKERQLLEERYKWVFGTVGVSVVTAIIGLVVSVMDANNKASDLQLQYLDKFTQVAIDEDITKRIRLAHYVMSTVDNVAFPTLAARWKSYYDALSAACLARGDRVEKDPTSTAQLQERPDCEVGGLAPIVSVSGLNLASIPEDRRPIAKLIAEKFAAAGYGVIQQAVAVAQAFISSGLRPDAKAAGPEQSYGLFQLNIMGGIGAGVSPDELIDPQINIQVLLDFMKTVPADVEYRSTNSVDEASSIMVRRLTRPANAQEELERVAALARTLLK